MNTLCAVANCYRSTIDIGLCQEHLRREEPTIAIEARFWEKVDKSSTCWIWIASRDIHGYGNFKIKEKQVKAHRFSYETFVSQIPNGYVIDHLCKNKSCVKPEHLEAVTHAENSRRGNGFANKQSAKTHCPHGHPYDSENTYITPAGYRECRKCRNDAIRATRALKPKVGPRLNNGNALKTECKYGHPFDEINTMYTGKQRRCRICHNRLSAESRKRAQS